MDHLRRIARDAGSILVGQLATIAFGVADTIMAGRSSSVDLAALSLGSAIYISLYVGLTGLVQALVPLVGHHHGAHDHERIGETFRQAVYLALIAAVPGMLVMWWPQPLLTL